MGTEKKHWLQQMLLTTYGSYNIVHAQYYTVFRKKHPLLFSFITSSQINQFAQKFQHL